MERSDPVSNGAAVPNGVPAPTAVAVPTGLAGTAGLAAAVPGPEMAAVLARVEVAALPSAELVDVIAAGERMVAWATALQARALAEFARRRPQPSGPEPTRVEEVSEFAADEIAAACALSRGTAGHRLEFALDLARLPATRSMLAAGRIGVGVAHRIVEGMSTVPASDLAAVEAVVLAGAPGRTPGQVQAAVRHAVLTADPAAAEARHRAALRTRRVELFPQADGMATVWALLDAGEALTAMDALRGLADNAATPDDGRGNAERMADALVDVCRGTLRLSALATVTGDPGAGGENGRPRRRRGGPAVQVTVASTTLLGLDDAPGQLAGYGPIPAAMAREVAAEPDGTWRRLLTEPASGTLLDVGRATYSPPAALARHVRARDRTCRFPGCRQPAHQCHLDHVVPHPAGATCSANLTAECVHHHRLKHESAWSVEAETSTPDVLVWTDPTGHRYPTYAPTPLAPV